MNELSINIRDYISDERLKRVYGEAGAAWEPRIQQSGEADCDVEPQERA